MTEQIPLSECPVGLFWYDDELYVKGFFDECSLVRNGVCYNINNAAKVTPVPLSQVQIVTTAFQPRVADWMTACFGGEIAGDRQERCDRFIEEALELAQTEPAFTKDRAHALVEYVFGREVGERQQEVGGVMVTLAALCNAYDIDMTQAGETELARVWTKFEAIRAKQTTKPRGSALTPDITTLPVLEYIGAQWAEYYLVTSLAEAKREISLLRDAVVTYGDRARMATVHDMAMQQAIDRAFDREA